MKIGFYGDSFCHSAAQGTWIEKVSSHLSADITNLGINGSSIWDVLLIQFFECHGHFGQTTEYNLEPNWIAIPDVLVFCWTDSNRLFNRTKRNINFSSMTNPSSKDPIAMASKLYYENLYDTVKHDFEYCSALAYFDEHILSKINNKRKIIHLWSFGKSFNEKYESKEDVFYSHRWKNGAEIRPPLFLITKSEERNYPLSSKIINHIGLEKNNQAVADCLINAIENYESGKIFEYDII